MNIEQKFKEETGFDAWVDNNLEPKIAMGYYVEWLEEQVEQLLIQRVSNTLTYDELKLIIKESCDIEDVRKKIDHRLG